MFGITRAGLGAGAEDAERAPGGLDLGRKVVVLDPRNPVDVGGPVDEERLELAAADDPERDLGGERSRGEDRLEPVERDQLADEERMKRTLGLPARVEEPVLGADEADLDALRGQPELLAEEPRVSVGVGDDDDRPAERPSIDEVHDSCTRATHAETARDRRRRVSYSETSGLKITGRPRATRFAAGRSK